MLIIAIGWLYVALMMAVAEATSTQGTLLGAIVTFLLYGVAPVTLVMYLLGTPMRWRAIRRQARQERGEAQDDGGGSALEPDAGGHAPADPVAPVRKEP